MSFWEWIGAAGTFASILGAFLAWASRSNGRQTRELVAQLHNDTLQVLERMDQRLERMDQRADERHQEMAELIQALARGSSSSFGT